MNKKLFLGLFMMAMNFVMSPVENNTESQGSSLDAAIANQYALSMLTHAGKVYLASDKNQILPVGTEIKFSFYPYQGNIYNREEVVIQKSNERLIAQPAKYRLKFKVILGQDLDTQTLFTKFDKMIKHIRSIIEKSNNKLGHPDVLFKPVANEDIAYGRKKLDNDEATKKYWSKLSQDFWKSNQYMSSQLTKAMQIENPGYWDNTLNIMEIVPDLYKQRQEWLAIQYDEDYFEALRYADLPEFPPEEGPGNQPPLAE